MKNVALPTLLLLTLLTGLRAAESPKQNLQQPMAPNSAVTFFVAPNGEDTNAGTEQKPFATLVRARDAARLAGKERARRIVVRGGTYYHVSLVLDAQDSGLEIAAAPGEKPILYGGTRVSGWEKDGDHFYAASLPGVKERTWDFRSLAVNGKLRPRARLPKAGEFTHLSRFDAPWYLTVGGGFRGADTPELKLHLKYQKGDLGPWLDVNNAELTIYHRWDDSVVGLKSHDPETQTLNFSDPSGYPPGAFGVRTFVVWNLREGMQEPGNWYLDRSRGKVVYWPEPGEDIHQLEVVAPNTQSIIELNGSQGTPIANVSIEGLHLCATTTPLINGGWAAGAFKGAIEAGFLRNCTLKNLHISAVGGQAIRMADSSGTKLTYCEISNIGASGICDSRGSGNLIADNHICGFGKIYTSAIGIREGAPNPNAQQHPEVSHDNQVLHNEVSDGPYVGIEFNGWKNRFEHNLVRDVMKVLADGAAFYGDGKDIVIRHNVVRDIPADKRAHGFYIDELGSGFLVEENLSVDCAWPLHMHLATGNTIRNNLFISERDAQLTFPKCSGFKMERNILIANGPIQVENPAGVKDWTDNLFFSRAGGYEQVPESVRKGDPLFVDAARMDYRFQADSPAPGLGIKPLSFRDVGPRLPAEASSASE